MLDKEGGTYIQVPPSLVIEECRLTTSKPYRSPQLRKACEGVAGCRLFLLLFLVVLVLAPKDLTARQSNETAVRGTVVDVQSGKGLEGADVVLHGTSLRVITDERGRFQFEGPGLAPGPYLMEVRHLGYATRADTLWVPDGASIEVTLAVSVEPIRLPDLEVITRSFLLELNGFYDRQRQGYSGVFLDRPAIERKRPNYVADLFRNIAGVEVVGGRIIMSQSSTFSGGGQGCAPAFWLDGIRSDRFSYDSIHPDQLEGAEVYTGGGAPMKYNDLCGTVVMWTRVPMRRR